MPNANVEVKAVFEEDVPAPTEFTITVKTDGNGTASASLAKAAAGTEITLTATPNGSAWHIRCRQNLHHAADGTETTREEYSDLYFGTAEGA